MTNDEAPAVAYPPVLLLAAGTIGPGIVSDYLALVASVPVGRDCG